MKHDSSNILSSSLPKRITELQALNYLKVIILRLFDYFYLINKLYKNLIN
jgi:hypothetical protein